MRFTAPENQDKVLLPLNSITEKIWYTNDNTSNMRVLVGAYTEHPVAWMVSKVENANPKGIQTLTLYQDFFDQHRDYIEKDENGKIIGLWADYYSFSDEPTDPDVPTSNPDQPTVYGKITASTSAIKIGGSYKTLTVKLYNADDEEITSSYSSSEFSWTCSVTDGDENIDLSNEVVWLNGNLFNQKKIKFPNDRNYLGKMLEVKCTVNGIDTLEKFELIGA